MKYYKVLNNDLSCIYGEGKWVFGEWMPHIENLVMCESGYHVCRPQDLVEWLGEAIFEVEISGRTLEGENKVVAQQARIVRKLDWTEKKARLFAADCAERVLPLYEKQCQDDRLRKAIQEVRDCAGGRTTWEILAAARDAALTAARYAEVSAASPAAWAEERQWQTKRLFEYLDDNGI